jgi:DNA polymerase-3 subunit alpha
MAIITPKINTLWVDVETTGLDPVVNDVIQLAAIAIVDGKRHELSFNEFCQPTNYDSVSDEALKVNNISRSQLATFQSAEQMVNRFIKFCDQFPGIKFTLAGYNVGFDRDFISSLFTKVNKEQEFNRVFNGELRDLYKRARALKAQGQLKTLNVKLSTLCAHFNIEINAHDALSDISATIQLDRVIADMLGDIEIDHSIVDYTIDQSLSFREPYQLHCHSKYSYTDSLTDIKDMVQWCLDTKTPGFAFADHCMAPSLFEFEQVPQIIAGLNKKNNTSHPESAVKAIPSLGLYVDRNGIKFFINAWATNTTGYNNLVKLASIGWSNRIEIAKVDFPVLNIADVYELSEGLVFGLPGVNGPAPLFLSEKRVTELTQLILELKTNLDLRLELSAIDAYKYYDSNFGFMTYKVKDGNMAKLINKFYWLFSKTYNVPCIPVSDSHFLDPDDKIIHDCICKTSFHDHRYFFESRHQLTAVEMYTILSNHIGAELTPDVFDSLIQNTYELADSVQPITITKDYHLPEIVIPEDIQKQTNDYNKQLLLFTQRKIDQHGRRINSPEYEERLKKELDVIAHNDTLNFLPYFLVYEDICSYTRSQGLMQGIARGSAGGSLLSYYLKIIHIDPVKYNLPFERFLSHSRIKAGSFPDIDLDIADKARGKVMQYLKDKYKLGFAQVATFQKMKTKRAITDAMYALYGKNRNDPEVKMVCGSIPDSPQGTDEKDFLLGYYDKEGLFHPGQISREGLVEDYDAEHEPFTNPTLDNFFKHRPEIQNMVFKLIGAIRGWSRHASAFVIATTDLAGSGRVPTMIMEDKELGEITVTQYDAPLVEKRGLVKADILGVKTLSMISECVELVAKNHNIHLIDDSLDISPIYCLPDSPGVYRDFLKQDTDSSFQFNSNTIKGVVKDFAPQTREHLSIMTALMRPGAMDAQLSIDELETIGGQKNKHTVKTEYTASDFYIKVRSGQEEPLYVHNDLIKILSETYGVIVYQEQVMEILVDICGYTLEETDIIRSAIAKKKHDVMMATFERIRVATKERGWTERQSDILCEHIQAFSRYSFNRSHSRAYAELGYITMYLKHHYPLEWWSSVLNNEDNSDKIRVYIGHLTDKVSPPSVKHPNKYWTIKNGKILAPLSSIKGVGPSVVDELVRNGPFTSLQDYIDRINHSRVNIGAMSALVSSRAADDLMDETVENYIERRIQFMNDYCGMRKSKTAFKEEMYHMTPLSIFLSEREINQSFNKILLHDSEIRQSVVQKWPTLRTTDNPNIPFIFHNEEDETRTYIFSSVRALERALQMESFTKEGVTVGFIGLFEESNVMQGVKLKSKENPNTGKIETKEHHWSKMSAYISDGYNSLECVAWDCKKPLRFAKNSLVYVVGKPVKGWRSPVDFIVSNANNFLPIDSIYLSKEKK